MAIEIYLGNPPQHVIDWIKSHSQPTGHKETWYKYAGDTEWKTVSISGSITGMPSEFGPPQPTTQIPNIMDVVELEIGTDVTNIGDNAIVYCPNLTSVTIPSSVTSIGDGAFSGCTGLTSVTIPNSVTSIGYAAFSDCINLTSVTFLGKTMEQIQEMDNYNNWGINPSIIVPGVEPEPAVHADTWYKYAGDTEWRTVSINGTIEAYIDFGTGPEDPGGTFSTDQIPQSSMVSELEIGTSVTSIGSSAFVDCGLTNVTIPDSVMSIGEGAFENCNGLTSITIGSGIQGIGSNAFATYGYSITLTIDKTIAEVQEMGYSNWSLPSGSTIVCTDGTIP